jgi:hypothetical protein
MDPLDLHQTFERQLEQKNGWIPPDEHSPAKGVVPFCLDDGRLTESEMVRVPDEPCWLLRHPGGDGAVRQGKVGLLTAAGGVGKTWVLIDLAVCVATGREWLGYFQVDSASKGRGVLLLLAEDDREEAVRRIWQAMTALGLSEDERRGVKASVRIHGLAGQDVSLLGAEGETPFAQQVESELGSTRGQIGLVIVDPISRFSGLNIDGDNTASTRFVSALERFAIASGAAVIAASHSSKMARRGGSADVRGASAIFDGVRWVGALTAKSDSQVTFDQLKSNLSRPMKSLALVREHGGRLRLETRAERSEVEGQQEASAAHLVEKVVASVAENPGKSKSWHADDIRGRRREVMTAVDAALNLQRITNRGTKMKTSLHVVAESPSVPGTVPAVPGTAPHIGGRGDWGSVPQFPYL